MARSLTRLVVGVLVLSGACATLKIAAWNSETFGKSKMSKPDVVPVLLQIAERYDILLIQDVRDQSETATEDFLYQLNARPGNDYSMLLSDHLGRNPYYMAQYGFLYKNDADLSLVDHYLYGDPGDIFLREPFIARFQFKGSDFVLVPLHADPTAAVKEIDALGDVYHDVVAGWNVTSIIILGNLQADCSYVRPSDWSNIRIRTNYTFNWLIGDYADTTVKESTDCAYDRIVVAGCKMQSSVQSASVFDYKTAYGLSQDEAEDVSDHYLVEMALEGL